MIFFHLSKLKRISFLTVLAASLLLLPIATSAKTSLPSENSGSTFTDLQKQLGDNLKKQTELQNNIKSAQNQEKTLATQITIIDSQVTLTELQIDETTNRIAQLAIDVTNTTSKLEKTATDLDRKTDVANDRVRTVYEQGNIKPLEMLLKTQGFNNYVLLQKYSEAIHDQDVKLITSLKDLKESYEAEKTQLSDQKKGQEDLKVQLDTQKSQLDTQKQQKSALLIATKNNEANYQKLLAQVKLDQQAIQAALFNLGTKLGPVKRGEIIAFQGNTGCSTGTHLHFGYLTGGKSVDPMPYLNNGTLAWPQVNPRITQPFGANAAFYAQLGQYGGHPAIDMTVSFGAPIYASKSGTAYLASDNGCPSLIPGTGKGYGISIDHGDGTKTIYWHIKH